MLFLVLSILPFFLLLSNSLLPAWASEARLLLVLFLQEFFFLLAGFREFGSLVLRIPFEMVASKRKCSSLVQNAEETAEMSILDLPDLALECILERLPPAALSNMAGVCRSLRGVCRSDHLWEKHMREKWGRVVGPAAKREWEWYLTWRRRDASDAGCGENGRKSRRWIRSLSCVLPPLPFLRSRVDAAPYVPDGSLMSWYLSLENGKFWFPAQVYNRENGHVGFMLSCYDAKLCYDSLRDIFQARYPPHGRRTVVLEEGVQWERIRAPPIDTPAHDLHVSDCLHDLRPGNHIEIQWRRNKEFPYGWWYGVVGHLEPCDGSIHFCRCHLSDTVVLEFNQYTPGSRWRRTTINRKDHREEGNEADGFYGGIRKLYTKDDISTWTRLWPVDVLE